jgi:Protein of unknown function (DUF742)
VTTPDDQPAAGHRRVRPYAMTGGRTRPTDGDLEIEALVSTTAIGEQAPRLTVEQRAIAALCHDILSIAEISARLHLPLGVIRVLWVIWPTSTWFWSTGQPGLGTVPTWHCWSGSCMGCTPSEGSCSSPAADRCVERAGHWRRRKGRPTTEIARASRPPIGRPHITTSAQARGGQRSSSAATWVSRQCEPWPVSARSRSARIMARSSSRLARKTMGSSNSGGPPSGAAT